MKLVITGALGHIGSRLIREMPTMFPNVDIVIVDNLSTQRYCSLYNLPKTGHFQFIEADVLTCDLESIFTGADVVIHLAAITDATNSFNNREQVELVNFHAVERVGKACCNVGCAMIFPSTTSVYGTKAEFVDEDCSKNELIPQSPYAESKLKAEEYLNLLGSQQGLNYIICRLGTICGVSPGMRFHTAVNKFCWQAVMGQPITVWRTAMHQTRPYLSLGDAIRAFGFIIRNKIFNRLVYNILTDNLTPREIIDRIEQHVGQVQIEIIDSMIMNMLSYKVSCQHFKDLGFTFSGSVSTDISDTIALLSTSNS